MASHRPNVLVYSGTGSTIESVRHCLYTLRRILSPYYAVHTISGEALINEPWTATCALLVMPGGADLGYCRMLNGAGNRKITQFVNCGGAYLGLCAGGYYGSGRCEFEVGDPEMEVIGDRELSFFPGICRGLAYSGFVYNSDAGARATELKIHNAALPDPEDDRPLRNFRSFYNGGGVFVGAEKFSDRKVSVLASYITPLEVKSDDSMAAVVHCSVGEGNVLLSGVHPEFAGMNLKDSRQGPPKEVIDAIRADDVDRARFLKHCLMKMNLRVSKEEKPVPSLSRLHLSSRDAADVAALISSTAWETTKTDRGGAQIIEGENDTFQIESPSHWSMSELITTLSSTSEGEPPSRSDADTVAMDFRSLEFSSEERKIVKRLVVHDSDLPECKETPEFHHQAYYSHLDDYVKKGHIDGNYGKHLLYGEVMESTNTILEKNPKLLALWPEGLTAVATTQVAGRGRGSNAWVSPPGALMFSTVVRIPQSICPIFVQYIAGMAVVQGIRSYDTGYWSLQVRLKWPNDIYVLDPAKARPRVNDRNHGSQELLSDSDRRDYTKIGGILINTSTGEVDMYTLIVGIGLNVANEAPTTSLNELASVAKLAPFRIERLLARILTRFEELCDRFKRFGWDWVLQNSYQKEWLHSDQIITIEGQTRARVKGITLDWGQLIAEELDGYGRETGKRIELQSDSNSFDFFKGLIRRKL